MACTRDAECLEVPGQTCIDFRGGQFCGYPNKGNQLSESMTQRCETSLDCDEGRTCVGRRCLTSAPCGEGCGEGTVCDLDSNTCSPAQCEQTCSDGQIAVLEDPDSMSGPQCCLVKCTCATLPPVRAGQYGWYASLAALSEGVVVSADDPDYGDLVVANYDIEGVFERVNYSDGFPTTGTLVGDPNGLQGGSNDNGCVRASPRPAGRYGASVSLNDVLYESARGRVGRSSPATPRSAVRRRRPRRSAARTKTASRSWTGSSSACGRWRARARCGP